MAGCVPSHLPYLPNVHLRGAVGADMIFDMMGGASLHFGMRSSIALAWRFGRQPAEQGARVVLRLAHHHVTGRHARPEASP